ncbi:MAG: hypothetical protein WAM60_10995 [Candidatus Promineifilaceae bacterium]
MDNEIEVMRVLRLPPMGKLVVEVNGQRYEQLSEVTNPSLKQRLLAAIGELIIFSSGYQTLVDAGVAPPLMVQSGGVGDTHEMVSPDLEERRAAFLSTLERQRNVLATQANAIQDPVNLVSAVAKDEAIPVIRPTNIVDQIDEILQKYVKAEPKLEGRSIHLEQAPAGGLRIKVDEQIYQRPAEIQEKEIQLVIKMALKEWEAH